MAMFSNNPLNPDPYKNGSYFNQKLQSWVKSIVSGEYFITDKADQSISTVLGSCVSACIRDPILKVGGMNHFMLPGDPNLKMDNALRYGVNAMETLLNSLYKKGCRKDNLEIKLFGGGDLQKFDKSKIGENNILFVEKFCRNEGFKIASKDLGGNYGRRIIFFPQTGKVLRSLLTDNESKAVTTEESKYSAVFKIEKPKDDIILF